jgi:hypothetical protein
VTGLVIVLVVLAVVADVPVLAHLFLHPARRVQRGSTAWTDHLHTELSPMWPTATRLVCGTSVALVFLVPTTGQIILLDLGLSRVVHARLA